MTEKQIEERDTLKNNFKQQLLQVANAKLISEKAMLKIVTRCAEFGAKLPNYIVNMTPSFEQTVNSKILEIKNL